MGKAGAGAGEAAVEAVVPVRVVFVYAPSAAKPSPTSKESPAWISVVQVADLP